MDENNDIYRQQFVNALLKENLTQEERGFLSALIARDLSGAIVQSSSKDKKPIALQNLNVSPRNTSLFLKRFDDPKELKILTHSFEAGNDDSPQDNLSMLKLANEVLSQQGQNIPSSLRKEINGFLNGESWLDAQNKSRRLFYWALPDFVDKCKKDSTANTLHPCKDEKYKAEIEAFKHAIRIRGGDLKNLVEELSKKHNLKFPEDEISPLMACQFYCYVPRLRKALDNILELLEENYSNHPDIHIRYQRSGDTVTKKPVHRIIIQQKGSFQNSNLSFYVSRLQEGYGGQFGTIKECLQGYAYWTVETKWADKPTVWNILRAPSDDEIIEWKEAKDSLVSEKIDGFRHIITIF